MSRKFAIALIVFSFTLGIITSNIFASNMIKIIFNGKEIATDVPPQNIKGRIMVPINVISKLFNADLNWDGKNKTVTIIKKVNDDDNNTKIIASLPSENISLYGTDKKDGSFSSIIIDINGFKKRFNWQTLSNPTFSPIISLNDINNDGEKELIIKLTTNEGTGVYINEVHVFNLRNLTEIEVENPLKILKKNLDIAPYNSFPNDSFGDQIDYEVIQNKLTAIIGIQKPPATYIGNVYITYQFKDGKYQEKEISFKQ